VDELYIMKNETITFDPAPQIEWIPMLNEERVRQIVREEIERSLKEKQNGLL